jgi:putative DNA methylase
VWEVVGRTALEQVLGTAEARARNGAAGALEEDARLTALFLWTMQSTNGSEQKANGNGSEGATTEDDDEDEDDAASTRASKKGFSLLFDVVRRFAQPLGIRLPEWEGRIIETKKGVVRLLSVSERARQLFGEEGAEVAADMIESSGKLPDTGYLPNVEWTAASPSIRRRGRKSTTRGTVSDESLTTHREATTLDRVHAAMILQSSGRANALRALLKVEQERGPDFVRLANALSALYPKDSEEKRLLDAMLLAVPR